MKTTKRYRVVVPFSCIGGEWFYEVDASTSDRAVEIVKRLEDAGVGSKETELDIEEILWDEVEVREI